MAHRKITIEQLQAAAKCRHSSFPAVVKRVKRSKKKKLAVKPTCKPVVKIDPVPAQVAAQVEKQPEIKEKPGKQVDWEQLNKFYKEKMVR